MSLFFYPLAHISGIDELFLHRITYILQKTEIGVCTA
jgi:hypothetical protein